MIKITVVIPVYNVEKYLNKCVDSVIAQNFNDFEIILVDDGSTDDSGVLCDDFASKYDFISVIHQENKGLGGARNTGIEAAKGEYILFLDSDDFIAPDCLEICYEKASQYNCDMVAFKQQAIFEDGNSGVIYNCSLPENKLSKNEETKSFMFACSACNRLYKTKLFNEFDIRFPDRLWYEDLRTTPKFLCHINSVYYYADKPLYFYLQRSGSIMHTPNLERIVKERIDAVKEISSYYEQNGFTESFSKELDYMHIFHGFFLPVREMQNMTSKFPPYADALRKYLLENVKNPAENPYVATLNKKEKLLLNLALKRNYIAIKLLSSINKLIKKDR